MVWRLLLRNVVQQAARNALSEQVARATSPGTSAEGDEPPSPPEPCQFGFVFALGIESGGLEDLLEDAHHTRGAGLSLVEGLLSGRRVAIVKTGVGQAAAARGAHLLIAGHRPQWIVSAGLAGGLHPDVRRGDFLFAETIVASDGSRFALGDALTSLAKTVTLPAGSRAPQSPPSRPAQVHIGGLLTVDRPIRLPHEKRALGERHQALAVDMESLAVATVCVQERTRFLSVRIVSDAVDDELPAEIEKLLDQKSAARRAGAAIGAILNRPGSLSDMLKLKEQALVASDQLAQVLAQIVARLE